MTGCEVCGAKVTELRRGRCWGCYTRWAESRPVGVGAACALCGEQRRDHLRGVELLGAWMPLCHNCTARATKLSPMPQSILEIRARLQRDRRAVDRRVGRADNRVFPRERRGDDRRRVRAIADDDPLIIDDGMIVEMFELADEIEAAAARPDEDLTRIRWSRG
jgi:hypothetical protein